MLQRLSPLFPYLRRYWRSFAWGGLALVGYNAAKAMVPLLIGAAIADMQHNLSARTVEAHAFQLLGIAAFAAVCLYLTRQIIIGASREIEFDLRNDLFAHLETQSPEFYQRHRTGDIMARSTNDLNAVRQLLGPAIMYSANTVVFTAAALPFMLRISPRLTLFAFLPLPFASVLVQYFGARIHKRFERIQAMFSDISAQAEENFSGARLIRAFAQEEAQIAAFETSNLEYIRRSLLLARLMAMLWPTLEFVLGVSIMITLLVGGHEIVAHAHNPQTGITVPQFTTYIVYMVQLTWPMIAIGWVVNLVQRGAASVVRLDALMQEPAAIDDSHADPALLRVAEQRNNNVVFLSEAKDPRILDPTDDSLRQQNGHPNPAASALNPQNRYPDPAASALKPQNGYPDPAASALKPQNGYPDPSVSALKPQNRYPDPAASALKPQNGYPDPAASALKPQNGYPDPSGSGLTATSKNGALAPAVTGHITFNHLTFAYPTGPVVLEDITLDIPAGTSLAITGPTGSGKSTLVSLLPRLYEPQDVATNPGTILLDGRPLRDYPLATLRAAIGFVPQETFLFSTTIADNIAFGDVESNRSSFDEIEAAARTAHIAAEIADFPAGFATVVGERGMTLSGGQKQRTAIARAILRDPRILILDDALASVDTYTEEQILTGLRSTMQGRTTILIAHRVSTARSADRIAVLINGCIAELGTHDELLARNGYYAGLYEKQSLEEEILTA